MNIYVGNLSYSTTEEGLKVLFEAHGTVESVRIITDKITGKSRGFGFVSMTNDDEGTNAIQALNNFEYESRTLTVSQANNPGDRPPRREGGPRSYGQGGGGSRGGFSRGGSQGGGRGGRFDRGGGDRF